MDSSMFDI
jgi:hypothetical protein